MKPPYRKTSPLKDHKELSKLSMRKLRARKWEKELYELKTIHDLDRIESYEEIEQIKDFISDLLIDQKEKMNDCTCKEKWTFGVVHRKYTPCYLPPYEHSIR